MRLTAAGASVRGPAHRQEGESNQDALGIYGLRGGWCAAVADGLGSRPHSRQGSRKAVNLLRQLMRRDCPPLTTEVMAALREAWLNHFGEGYRDYETTCLWACIDVAGYGLVGQVGDGLLLVRCGGVFNVLSIPRRGYSNQTSTLAQLKPRECCCADVALTQSGDGVLMMTDGIADDLIPEQLEPFFNAIYRRMRCSSRRRMRRWLTKELNGWSTPHHGDDKSLAGIFRTD
ncbi:PP2C family serine/threonine-protein phosphatase [Pectobacterium parmentieri]|uniref:Protein phosphatase 2C domain-containing protein n=1 Tax=Pectobacterium parmentieri TaxID=1905730 RepID=A0ABS0RYH8_PECPM|nr:PP2C family serine/threonine-protein phosphatase [Pectobacterium parmentieri]MBI0471277.1 protein phosphatase 2C domain-containing protein [Pectobacterium parmentieri]MBI0493889.1 protein phosphatase 2C domain-containing protein [Pectobacterium parmentieri]MBI0554689.1 protein phosphatase 2C domain-containing protein [Pectobacterium parmentieri]MBI0568155.1 protein phosphatase 2C domain-containing protein [Pectobacterium parmentieri]MBI0573124.1 protein phosphatase 2C domain-containing prot